MMSSSPLVSFLITLLLAVCAHGEEHVRDTAGDIVHTDKQYFIQPVNTGNKAGGLVPAAVTLLPFCPLGITQALLPHQPGLPVSFAFPYPLMETNVSVKQAVNIEFKSDIWICSEFSKFWEVDESSRASKEPAVLVGGKQREKNSWFRIERAEKFVGGHAYKLTTLTGTVGTIPGLWGGAPQLVITNDTAKTLLVEFKKVDDATTTATTSRVEKLGLRMFPFY